MLAVDPVADRWRIVIYFDLPASTPGGVEAAATALGEVAEQLVALGDVEVVTSDRIVEVVLEPTRDAGELRQAAAEVAGRAHEAGGVLTLRREMKAAAAARSGDPNADGLRTADLLEGFLQELDTLDRQRSGLLESLRLTSWTRGPPRALLLVRDGMDLNADAFAQRMLGGPTPAFERAAVSEQRQQRSLGASGCRPGLARLPPSRRARHGGDRGSLPPVTVRTPRSSPGPAAAGCWPPRTN